MQKLNIFAFSTDILDTKKFCVIENRLIWALYIDVLIYNDDGNIFDAILRSILSAIIKRILTQSI